MDMRKVKKLIELLNDNDLSEIELKEGEETVRIARQAALTAQPVISAPAINNAEDTAATAEPSTTTKGQIVSAPMVGTFYQAPSPGSPPFVEVGDRVKVGDVLCIVESMKMMNQIKSTVSGVVEAVLVPNESAVEFEQPLFTII